MLESMSEEYVCRCELFDIVLFVVMGCSRKTITRQKRSKLAQFDILSTTTCY